MPKERAGWKQNRGHGGVAPMALADVLARAFAGSIRPHAREPESPGLASARGRRIRFCRSPDACVPMLQDGQPLIGTTGFQEASSVIVSV